jgi:hypothetical protein
MDRHNCHHPTAVCGAAGMVAQAPHNRNGRPALAPAWGLTSGLPQIETCDPIANLNYRELYVHIGGATGNITKQRSHTLASASLLPVFPR